MTQWSSHTPRHKAPWTGLYGKKSEGNPDFAEVNGKMLIPMDPGLYSVKSRWRNALCLIKEVRMQTTSSVRKL